MLDREREIEEASLDYFNNMHDVIESDVCISFSNGAKWADEHALCKWNDLNVLPEPNDDIIVSKVSSGKNKERMFFWWKGKMLIESINNGSNKCDKWMKLPIVY